MYGCGSPSRKFLFRISINWHTGPSIFLFKKNKKKIQYGPYGTSMHVLCSVMSSSQDFERQFHLNVKGSRFQAYYDKVNWPLDMSP